MGLQAGRTAGRKPTWGLYDRVLNGQLEEILRGGRAEGLGARKLSRRLHDDHNIDVSPETVRRWLLVLEAPTSPDEASA